MSHENYMKMALELAEKGRFSVAPNPMVGAVLVKDNVVLGKAYHQKSGEPHAEILAINSKDAKDATLYINLEPCSHFGKTPPCAPELIKSGIKEIYIATLDPNPLVNGKGVELLKKHGIKVHIGLLEKEAREQNKIFFHYMTKRKPFVIAKWAMSLDGKTTVRENDERQLSSLASQQETHRLRQEVDAILIGANTAIKDNPQLTVRYQPTPIIKHPIRLVIVGKTLLPLDLTIFNSSLPAETWVFVSANIDKKWCQALIDRGIKVIELESNANHQINLHVLLEYLGSQQITSVLVEGGMTILNSFFTNHLINEYRLFLTPHVIAESSNKVLLNIKSVTQSGNDYYFTAENNNHV